MGTEWTKIQAMEDLEKEEAASEQRLPMPSKPRFLSSILPLNWNSRSMYSSMLQLLRNWDSRSMCSSILRLLRRNWDSLWMQESLSEQSLSLNLDSR